MKKVEDMTEEERAEGIKKAQATELMWWALEKGTNKLLYYAPSLKELDEIIEEKGLKNVVYHKDGYYMQAIPKWSRLLRAKECVCSACGDSHMLDLPEDRDWRGAQGL